MIQSLFQEWLFWLDVLCGVYAIFDGGPGDPGKGGKIYKVWDSIDSSFSSSKSKLKNLTIVFNILDILIESILQGIPWWRQRWLLKPINIGNKHIIRHVPWPEDMV